jgi:hypothetical protein
MKSAIVIFFDKSGMPIECKLACHKSKELELEKMARRMMQAAIEGPHVCQCAGKCKHGAA